MKAYEDPKSKARLHVKTALFTLDYFKDYQIPQKPNRSVNISRRPGTEGRKTIIFDLDETLVHCVDS